MNSKKNISLLQFLWNIELDLKEKDQLSEYLKDKDSLPFYVFNVFATKSKKFKEYSKVFQKHIKGFSPGRASYYPEVQKHILKELVEKKAKTFSWIAYRHAIVQWMTEELTILSTLLNKAEVEKDLKATSINFIENILDNASNFDINPKDLKQLYEVWPFERIENFNELLKKCKAFELPVLNKKELNNIESKLIEFENDINSLKEVSKNQKLEKDMIENLLKKERSSYFKDFSKEIEKIQKKIETKIDKQDILLLKSNKIIKEEFKKEIGKVNKEIDKSITLQSKDCTSSFDKKVLSERLEQDNKIKDAERKIDKLEENLKKLKSIDSIQTHVDDRVSVMESDFNKQISDLNRRIISYSISEKNDSVLDNYLIFDNKSKFRTLEEDEFLKDFSTYLDLFNFNLKDHEILASHIFLKENPVLIINDRGLFDSWVNALGWSPYLIKFAASPRWSSPIDLHEDILNILQNESELPIFVEIFNFDLGLVEGYLLPIITLWNENNFNGRANKIILHPSEQISKDDILIISEYANYLGGASYKSDVESCMNYDIGASFLRNGKMKPPVSIDSFYNWIYPPKDINKPLITKFITDCHSILSENGIEDQPNIFNGIPDIISRYDTSFFNNELIYSSFLEVFLYPWIMNFKDRKSIDS